MSLRWPVTALIASMGAGPMLSTVFESGAICVRPASTCPHIATASERSFRSQQLT